MEFNQGHYLAMTITAILVFACVLLHYEILRFLTVFLRKIKISFRVRILILIFGLLTAHLIEVWIFAFGYFYMDQFAQIGSFIGITPVSFFDYAYFSVATYTTLGYGDIVPYGPIRFLSTMEALTGMVIVAWSASFTFIEMRLFWKDDNLYFDSSKKS